MGGTSPLSSGSPSGPGELSSLGGCRVSRPRWAGLHADSSSAGLGRGGGCGGDGGVVSPRAHSHVGNKPGGRVREIYTLTESGVLLAGQPFLGGSSLRSQADLGLLSQATEGNESGRLSTV